MSNASTSATPGPGVYPGTAMAEYHRWDAASNSRLSKMLRSAAHTKAAMEQDMADTAALRQGRISHTAILEPDHFASRYVIVGQCDGETKAGKRCSKSGSVYREGGAFCAQHDPSPGTVDSGGPEVISESERDVALAQRDSAYRKRSARALLEGAGEVELSVLWHDQETEVLCKGRWDRHSPEIAGGAIVDLKTAQDASLLAFERSIFSFGYHRQAGLYLDGAKVRRLPAKRFVIIAVEKDPPYEAAVYRLTDGATDAGLQQARVLLRRYAECQASGEWPGYPDRVQDISLPPWAWNQMDEQTEQVEEAA
jgi:hypothetical protein